MVSADRAETRLATRLSFLAAGYGIACWAPLVPFAKARLDIDDGQLGLLLLCLGTGSILAMPATGVLSARYGAKPIIIAGGIGITLLLPLLAVAATPLSLGVTLFVFGASLGSLEVAMNVHAVEVEHAADRPLMSGFHALFSIGGFAGSGAMTLFLSSHVSPLISASFGSIVLAGAVLLAWPRLLQGGHSGEKAPLFVRPRGIVLLIAALAAATFLAEGAILDWSALLITGVGLVTVAQGGVGYMIFSIAMTLGRLWGDGLVARVGNRNLLLWGGVTAVAGFAVLLFVPITVIALIGFFLIGFGASNIVPVLFRQAGAQKTMPASLAVGAITTTGYAGILAGPAVIGFVAHSVGLTTAFWLLAALFALVPIFSQAVTADTSK